MQKKHVGFSMKFNRRVAKYTTYVVLSIFLLFVLGNLFPAIAELIVIAFFFILLIGLSVFAIYLLMSIVLGEEI